MEQQTSLKKFQNNSEVLKKEFLDEKEIFLLKFLKNFDRKTTREWEELGLWR